MLQADITDEYGIHAVTGQESLTINMTSDVAKVCPSFTPATLTIFGDLQVDENSNFKKLIYYQLQHPHTVNHNFLTNR